MNHPLRRHQPPRRTQTGAVLIVSLVILLILTLIGVSAMNNTILEQKISKNDEERNRALHAAETGIAATFNNPTAFDVNHAKGNAKHLPEGGGFAKIDSADVHAYRGEYQSDTHFRAWTSNPPRAASVAGMWSAGMRAAHFEVSSTGNGNSDAEVNLVGGGYQITK